MSMSDDQRDLLIGLAKDDTKVYIVDYLKEFSSPLVIIGKQMSGKCTRVIEQNHTDES